MVNQFFRDFTLVGLPSPQPNLLSSKGFINISSVSPHKDIANDLSHIPIVWRENLWPYEFYHSMLTQFLGALKSWLSNF